MHAAGVVPTEAVLIPLENRVLLPFTRGQIQVSSLSEFLSASWVVVTGVLDSVVKRTGTLCRVIAKPTPDQTMAVEGFARVFIEEDRLHANCSVRFKILPDEEDNIDVRPQLSEIGAKLSEWVKLLGDEKQSSSNSSSTSQVVVRLPSGTPQMVASLVAAALLGAGSLSAGEVQTNFLEESRLHKRLLFLSSSLSRAIESTRIKSQVNEAIVKKHKSEMRAFLIKKQIAELQAQLKDGADNGGGEESEVSLLKKRFQDLLLPDSVKKIIEREFKRIDAIQTTHHPEYPGILSYLETVAALPWRAGHSSELMIDLNEAKIQLDKHHFGMAAVKRRIVEFLAVEKLLLESNSERRKVAQVLCLLGAPGVGKTSIAASIAKAMNRKFVRISLGGIRDESELRGHRKTYIGAMPGLVIQAIIRAGVSNPVILLDEIDKVSYVGNSVSARSGGASGVLLELLDPEQNTCFRDAYLNFGFDLSHCVFVCTCNTLSGISQPLMDRLDIVNVEGYSLREKIEIAKKHLIPRALSDCGLTGRIEVGFESDAVIEFLIARHTAAEAGVRNLARRLADIFRFIALEISSSSSSSKTPPLTVDDISRILGPALEQGPSIPTALPVGVSLGLAVSQTGGEVLFVECVTTGLGTGSVTVTGQLGDVMKESVSTALSVVRSSTLIMMKRIEKNFDIHVHFPTASVHKDGPSAGLSTFIAIASLFSNVSARSDMASSGEITLRGEVLPIGGVKQKVAAAHRAGLKTVLLPWGNKGSLRPGDLPAEVEREVKLVFVRNVQEVLRAAFPATANVTTTPHYESAL